LNNCPDWLSCGAHLHVELFDAVVRPLNDAVDGVVNERDAGRVRAEQVGVDGSGEGTGDALQPGELAEHVTH